jgi:prephenate dehydrogenase
MVKLSLLDLIPHLLPESVSYVSGNPILRWEETAPGVREATTSGATYCLLPSRRTMPEAVETLAGFVGAIGASPLFLDPPEHDAYMAATVQLPELLSAAMLGALTANPSWREMRRVAGDVLTQSARTIGHPTSRAAELNINRVAVGRWIDQVIEELQGMRQLMESDTEALEQRITAISDHYWRLMTRDPGDQGLETHDTLPNIKEEMGRAFLGGRIMDSVKKIGGDKK